LIDNTTVTDGSTVTAEINGTVFGTMASGSINSYYALIVVADDVETPVKDGGVEGDTVIIKVNGNVMVPSLTWTQGSRKNNVTFNNDLTAPASVTNLNLISKSDTWLYWNWSNPSDIDFNISIIYLDGINIVNTSNNFYNATGLSSSTNYTITVHTIDHSGNINTADVNDTQTTDAFVLNEQVLLCDVAKQTWKYFNASTSSTVAASCNTCTVYGYGLPRGSRDLNNANAGFNANPADFGLYLGSIVAAHDLGFINDNIAENKLRTTLTTLIDIQNDPSKSTDGLFMQYYNPVGGTSPTVLDNQIPSAENAWLVANLLSVEEFAILQGMNDIQNKADQIMSKMNMTHFFNDNRWTSSPAEQNVFVHS